MNTVRGLLRLLGALCLLAASTAAQPSLIAVPHGSGRDSDLAGIVVAAPDDGSSALVINPAGVVGKARKEALLAIVPGSLKTSYQNPTTGYDAVGSKDPVGLGLWYGMGEIHGWSLGFGAYGSLGTAFDLPASPDTGQTSPFLGELGIINFGLVAGRQLTSNLRFGLQLSPSYGMQETRMPSPLGDIRFETKGFGIGGSAGLVYALSDTMSLGLAYRFPGVVKLDGDGHVGDVKQDVSVTLVTPQSITTGLAYRWSDHLRLLGQVVWTRYKDFERGDVEFDKTPALNGPVLSSARNRARWGVAMEYEFIPNHVFRMGFTRGKAMIENEAVSPTLYDHDDDMIMAGYEVDLGTWRLGLTAGYARMKDRTIDVTENPYYPGTYKTESPISVGVRTIWELEQ